MFSEWKNLILEHVHKQKYRCRDYSYNKLRQDFVLVHTDKASNNETIVCKKLYAMLIEKEWVILKE